MESVMTIAGSDPSGGAGISADIKTFSALGLNPTSVITNVTVQNEDKFFSNTPVEAKVLKAQIEAILACHTIKAVKIGMVYTKENLRAIKRAIIKHQLKNIVLDPIVNSTTGAPLAEYDTAFLQRELFPHVDIVTPNVHEAAAVTNKHIVQLADLREAALEFASFGCESVVVTGFDDGGQHFVDMLYDGENFKDYKMKRLKVPDIHGTGCTFSAALAGYLALGRNLNMAVREAKEYTFNAIKHAHKLENDRLTLNHCFMLNG